MIKTKFENKNSLIMTSAECFDFTTIDGKLILFVMHNNFIDVGYVHHNVLHNALSIMRLDARENSAYRYIFDKFNSTPNCTMEDLRNDEFSDCKKYVKALEGDDIDWTPYNWSLSVPCMVKCFILVDDINIVYNHDDVELSPNTLNMVTFDKQCTYYTSGQHLGIIDGKLSFVWTNFYNNDRGWLVTGNALSDIADPSHIAFTYNINLINGEEIINE